MTGKTLFHDMTTLGLDLGLGETLDGARVTMLLLTTWATPITLLVAIKRINRMPISTSMLSHRKVFQKTRLYQEKPLPDNST